MIDTQYQPRPSINFRVLFSTGQLFQIFLCGRLFTFFLRQEQHFLYMNNIILSRNFSFDISRSMFLESIILLNNNNYSISSI